MLGSPHVRARRRIRSRRPAPNRAGFGFRAGCVYIYLNSFFCLKRCRFATSLGYHWEGRCHFGIGLKRLLHTLRFEIPSSAQFLVRQPTKRSAFFVLGDHFIQGDELPITRSTTAREINCLKEIVSNTRLDHS